MQVLPFQPEITERMLAGTDGETIHHDPVLMQTADGYQLAQHDSVAALLTPDNSPSTPCFWAEGAQSLAGLVTLVENGGFDEVGKFDGNDDSWHEAAAGCSGHGHNGHCRYGH